MDLRTIIRLAICAVILQTPWQSYTKPAQADPVEAKMRTLYGQFFRPDNSTLSWKCFALRVHDMLHEHSNPKYRAMAKAMKNASEMDSRWSIKDELEPHASSLPKELKRDLDNMGNLTLFFRLGAGLAITNNVCPALSVLLATKKN